MRVNKKIRKKPNYINIGIIITVAILIITTVITLFMLKDTLDLDDKPEEIKVLDSIEGYNYKLTENSTKYYKSLFNELKELLSGEFEEEEYASLLTKIFLSDFFDLNSKTSKNDVGGTSYVYEPYQTSFIKSASDINGIYYYVKSNIYKERTQELPIVSSVTIDGIEKISYDYNDTTDPNAYKVNATITYEKDLGYQTGLTVIIIHNNNKLEIAEME